MKYYGKTKILIPWFDTEGMKQRTLITIEGTIDKRALIRGVKSFAKQNFNKTVSTEWVLASCPIINQFGSTLTMITDPDTLASEVSQEEIEAWIQRLQSEVPENETKAGTDISSQDANPDETEQPLLTVQDFNDSGRSVS